MIDALKYQFNDSIKRYGYDVVVNGTKPIKVLFKEYQQGRSPVDYKYMLVENGLAKQGDIVSFFGDNWLVQSENMSVNDVYTKFTIRRLKFEIKFNFEGDVIAFPSAIDEGSLNTQTGDAIQIQKGQIVLHMKEDEQSERIEVNQRFITMRSAWKIEQITNTEHGLYRIYAESDLFDKDDDRENEIADRWKYEMPPENIISVEDLSGISVAFGTDINTINLPKTVVATVQGRQPSEPRTQRLNVNWDTSPYNKDIAGIYILEGEIEPVKGITNTDNIKATLTITVEEEIVGVDIVSVFDISDITIPYSTEVVDIGLPATVTVELEDCNIETLNVNWDTSPYDKDIAGVYTLYGTIELIEGITNTSNIQAIVDVIVEEEVVEEGLRIELTGDDKVGAITEGSYVATVYENGNVVSKPVTFTLSNTLATFTSKSDNECTLIGNEDFRTGDTILRATLVEDETVFAEKSVYVAGF